MYPSNKYPIMKKQGTLGDNTKLSAFNPGSIMLPASTRWVLQLGDDKNSARCLLDAHKLGHHPGLNVQNLYGKNLTIYLFTKHKALITRQLKKHWVIGKKMEFWRCGIWERHNEKESFNFS